MSESKGQELTDDGVKLFEWRLALHSLTPGGSEFCTPKACEDWVRQHRDRQHEHVLDEINKRKALQDRLTTLETLVKALPKIKGTIFETVASCRGEGGPESWVRFEVALAALLTHRQSLT